MQYATRSPHSKDVPSAESQGNAELVANLESYVDSLPVEPVEVRTDAEPQNDPALQESSDPLTDNLATQLAQLRADHEPQEKLDETFRLVRRTLRITLTTTWRGVARGDLQAPSRARDALLFAQPFIDAVLDEPPPALAAAMELHAALNGLDLAEEALEELRTVTRLRKADRTATERRILKILVTNRTEFLRRQQVHKLLVQEGGKSVTVERVAQVLTELQSEGILQRIRAPAQGNPRTAHYALSGTGVEVCKGLESAPPPKRRATAKRAKARKQEKTRVKVTVTGGGLHRAARRAVAPGKLRRKAEGAEGAASAQNADPSLEGTRKKRPAWKRKKLSIGSTTD